MAKFDKRISIVDTHTGGQPTRTIVSGLPYIRGSSMVEKREYFRKHFDWLRIMLTSEPRGTALTSVAVLTEPTMPEADIGALYMERHGYFDMCGHDTIGVGTMLVEMGLVEVTEPYTYIGLETPAGLVKLKVHVIDGRVQNVSFLNIPCFVFGKNMEITYQDKPIRFDVVYGGIFYGIVPVEQIGVELKPENHELLVQHAIALRKIINETFDITHPEKPYMHGIQNIEFVDPVQREGKELSSRNMVVFPPNMFDRSPCGTGTSARMTLLSMEGKMEKGETLTHYSLINSVFKGEIEEVIPDFHGYYAVRPRVTGSAKLCGFYEAIVDPSDEKGYGFSFD